MGQEEQALDESQIRSIASAVADGDVEAFGRLYDLYVDRIFRYVHYRVGARAEAEDLTEQVFLKALQASARYRAEAAPYVVWLLHIARNTVIDYFRTRRISVDLEEAAVQTVSWADPLAVANLACTREELRDAILALKQEYRRVIVMRFLDDLTYTQIAAALGKSEGAVRVLQHRALQSLRETMLAAEVMA